MLWQVKRIGQILIEIMLTYIVSNNITTPLISLFLRNLLEQQDLSGKFLTPNSLIQPV